MGVGLKTLILSSLVLGLFQGRGCTAGCCCESSCPPFWTHYEGSCYRVFGSCVSWTDANRECQRQGSQLASVHSAGEDAFIYELWRSWTGLSITCRPPVERGYWIGLNDVTTEGQFVYTDGSAVDYTNWKFGQPANAGGGEDCVHIWYLNDSPGTGYGWNDWQCDNALSLNTYVCKMDAV